MESHIGKRGRPPGSPNKLTAEVAKAVCGLLEASVPDRYAAEANGLSERTFRRWMELGAAGRKPYAEFFAAATRARARAVVRLVVKALSGGPGSYQALRILERRYPRYFGRSGARVGPLSFSAFEGAYLSRSAGT